jgi:hypothetical protein
MREGPSAQRGRALEQLLARRWPQLPADQRRLLAANCRYLLTATTWNYHRQHFGLGAEQAVVTVQSMLSNLLRGAAASQVSTAEHAAHAPPKAEWTEVEPPAAP